MTAYSYFPGCSLTSTAIEYDTSFRLVAAAFGIGLKEIEDWNCCGASPAPHHWGGNLGVFLPARNLHIAGARGEAMVAPCAGCYSRHKYAQFELGRDEDLRRRVEATLDEPVRFETEVMNVVQFFNAEIEPADLSERAGGRLSGVRLGAYYGCALTRPAGILQFDDPENPVSMEALLTATGAEVPHFPFKTDCCGAYMGLAKKEIVLHASRRVIAAAVECGIDALVTACPLCHQNLDLRQKQINRAFGTSLKMPVLYFSQALGLGLGYSVNELGIDAHAVGFDAVLGRIEDARRSEAESQAAPKRPSAKVPVSDGGDA